MSKKTGIYFNDADYEQIKNRAAEYNQTFGRFVKNAALDNPIKITRTADPRVIHELRFFSSNLNQVAKHLNVNANNGVQLNNDTLNAVHDLIEDIKIKISNIRNK